MAKQADLNPKHKRLNSRAPGIYLSFKYCFNTNNTTVEGARYHWASYWTPQMLWAPPPVYCMYLVHKNSNFSFSPVLFLE